MPVNPEQLLANIVHATNRLAAGDDPVIVAQDAGMDIPAACVREAQNASAADMAAMTGARAAKSAMRFVRHLEAAIARCETCGKADRYCPACVDAKADIVAETASMFLLTLMVCISNRPGGRAYAERNGEVH